MAEPPAAAGPSKRRRVAGAGGGNGLSPAAAPLVSIICPVHNAKPWLDDCFGSILAQTYPAASIQVSIYDDASTDGSAALIAGWAARFRAAGVGVVLGGLGFDPPPPPGTPPPAAGGIGFAKNRAIEQSSGDLLCFFDADDIMLPTRIARQAAASAANPAALIGGGFIRIPADATPHYTTWANTNTPDQLWLDQFRECTVLMPTWLLPRGLFDTVGLFKESAPAAGEGEDLQWFQSFLSMHGAANQAAGRRSLVRVGDMAAPVLKYRFLATSGSWRVSRKQLLRISRKQLLRIRAAAFERRVLGIGPAAADAGPAGPAAGSAGSAGSAEAAAAAMEQNGRSGHTAEAAAPAPWAKFVIWGAGRDGRALFGALGAEARARVVCMCDIDPKKTGREYMNSQLPPPNRLPVVHFSELEKTAAGKAALPVVVCVTRRRKGPSTAGGGGSSGGGGPEGGGGGDSADNDSGGGTGGARGAGGAGAEGAGPTTAGDRAVGAAAAGGESGGELERNVGTLGLVEGQDLWHFV